METNKILELKKLRNRFRQAEKRILNLKKRQCRLLSLRRGKKKRIKKSKPKRKCGRAPNRPKYALWEIPEGEETQGKG